MMKKEIRNNLIGIVSFFVMTILGTLITAGVFRNAPTSDQALLDTSYTFLLGMFIHMVIYSGFFSSEKSEEKYHGYEFYKSLPITDRQIVAGKYAAVAVYGLAAVGFLTLINYLTPVDPIIRAPRQSFLIFTAGIGIMCVGVLYIFAIFHRFSAVQIPSVIVYMLCLMFPMMSHLIFGENNRGGIDRFFSEMSLPFALISFAVCVLVFVGAMRIAVRRKETMSL
ncbi:MAG: ABC-2 transporter permease [Anaerolineaceae bacterium]|nr:ABC-2 transporter permease [Anaerolineaceae bacterium]